jgi:hypothetical protein
MALVSEPYEWSGRDVVSSDGVGIRRPEEIHRKGQEERGRVRREDELGRERAGAQAKRPESRVGGGGSPGATAPGR